MAKLYGNYSALVGYWSHIAIANITGTPGFKMYIYNPATAVTLSALTVWNFFTDVNRDDIVVANSRTTSFFGITTAHAYTVLNGFEVTLLTGTTVKLIKMRNPVANDGALTSAYGDTSAEWSNVSATEKTRIGYKLNSADGDFFMTIEQFIAAF